MSNDVRSATLDDRVSDRLSEYFEVDVPAGVAATLDRRVAAAMSSALDLAGSNRDANGFHPRRKSFGALAIAALVVVVAASPVIEFFEGWGAEFDRVFETSTPIDQAVTDDGYRVTVVRAYGDPESLRLAIVAEDLRDRGWSEIVVGSPTVTDDQGIEYPMMSGAYRAPTLTSSEGWLRYAVPSEATAPGTRHLSLKIDGLRVRPDPAPTLSNGEIDLDNVWTAVPGSWSFDFDLDFFSAQSSSPNVAASVGDVTVTWNDLSVTPAATVGRLTIAGLPEREVDWAWDTYFRVEHDGRTLDLEMTTGSVQDELVFEAVPGFDTLSGTWVITIDQFHRDIPDPISDVTTKEELIAGPWVLRFEAPTNQ